MSNQSDTESRPPNWARFYVALNRLGPLALKEFPKEWVRGLQVDGESADLFWTEDIEYVLSMFWNESPELAVKEALTQYVDSVQMVLSQTPYSDGLESWREDPTSGEMMPVEECIAGITCHPVRPRILRALVDAASQPEECVTQPGWD